MATRPETPVTLVGTGAMACLLAARLSPHTPITMLGNWKQGLQALQQEGVRLVDTDGSEKTVPVRATGDPKECGKSRFAIVLVKSWQTARAAEMLESCLAEDGIALTLQNGLGNIEQLQQALGRRRATLGVTTQGATLLGPGRVRASGGGLTHLGEDRRIDPLAGLLRKAGLQVERVDHLEGLLWGKLAINAGINPLTALLQVPNGKLLENPQAKALMITAAQETAILAAKQGIALPYSDASAAICDVAERTASNLSSMLQDIRRGAPTEIEAINGAIARLGEKEAVPVPLNRTLWKLVAALAGERAGEET